MMNRKRTAEDASLDEKNNLNDNPGTSSKKWTTSRPMQGDGEDGNKHTIDSDEEEDFNKKAEEFDVLNDDEIEGQEDDSKVDKDGEVKITPFNLTEEREEGDFSVDGNFVWKKTTEIQDAWLDNVDWVKVKDVTQAEQIKKDANDDAEDEAEAAYNETEVYKSVLALMKPGDTVAKAIRRLSGAAKGPGQQKVILQKERKIAQKLKKKQKLTDDEETFQRDREDMKRLTGFADSILTRSGNMEVYEETYEKIAYRLKEEDEKATSVTDIPEGMDDDDALDMFADNFNAKSVDPKAQAIPSAKPLPTPDPTEKPLDIDSEVMWEFKWEDTDDAEVHGPHSSTKMLKWQESGFFDKGMLCRKVGDSSFLDGKRVDFDLYT